LQPLAVSPFLSISFPLPVSTISFASTINHVMLPKLFPRLHSMPSSDAKAKQGRKGQVAEGWRGGCSADDDFDGMLAEVCAADPTSVTFSAGIVTNPQTSRSSSSNSTHNSP
jgi:hypothetical protein